MVIKDYWYVGLLQWDNTDLVMRVIATHTHTCIHATACAMQTRSRRRQPTTVRRPLARAESQPWVFCPVRRRRATSEQKLSPLSVPSRVCVERRARRRTPTPTADRSSVWRCEAAKPRASTHCTLPHTTTARATHACKTVSVAQRTQIAPARSGTSGDFWALAMRLARVAAHQCRHHRRHTHLDFVKVH